LPYAGLVVPPALPTALPSPVSLAPLQVIKPGLVKGPWKPEEDAIILKCLADGITKWSEIAERIAGRIGKQCRERYFNHLDREWTSGCLACCVLSRRPTLAVLAVRAPGVE